MTGERVVFAGSEVQVTRTDRGRAAILRFAGSSSRELLKWLPAGFKEVRHSVVVNLRALSGIDAPFVQKLLDLAGRKHPLALVDPPPAVLDVLGQLCVADRVPLLSCEAAVSESGEIPDSTAAETMQIRELEQRFRINPLWRRIDQDGLWLCALCGMEVDEARIRDVSKPEPAAFRRMRRHLLEDCMGARAGRSAPLPASVLDAFLADINQRKRSEDAERKQKLAVELQTLQTRVESMQELERSVDSAMRRQLHLLPIEPGPDDAVDIAVHYRPLQAVSGDFLDFYALEDDRFGVSVGDVSGHGIETAIVMGMAKMALRVRSQGLGPLREVVACANRDLFAELRRTAFVTGVFAAIDRASKRMSYVRAGHTKPILRRASGEVEELDAPGLPFGIDGGARFLAGLEEREVQLETGDVLFLYTDGLSEASAAGEQYGTERLREVLRTAPPELPAQAVLAVVVASLDRFLAGAPLGDDLTAVCLKVK
jgi:serine phosphatase RsbU (regulator of sigma subunit)